jgi:CelD/BcsL family acetyltransferase involved in cellulose biosynthesis
VAHIQFLDPRVDPEWDAFVDRSSGGTVFHTSAWASVLAETYSFAPRYLAAIDDSGSVVAGIPTMLVRSRLTGRRLVGLPFSDACAPLAPDCGAGDKLIDTLVAEARNERCRYLELRGDSGLVLDRHGFKSFQFLHHEVSLDRPLAQIDADVSPAKRRARNKAKNEGVEVSRSTELVDVKSLYHLYLLTRRKHGLPPAPYSFFENIHRFLIANGMGCVLLAKWRNQVVAADLVLWHRDSLYYKFNVWDTHFQDVRPNDLLLWEAIKLGTERALRVFDLGRCEVDNSGLRQFKKGWSAIEMPLSYYYYPDVRGFVADDQDDPQHKLLGSLIRHTPSGLLARFGALYGHLA